MEMENRFVRLADKFNRSPVWNHTMMCVFLYAMEMCVLVLIVIGKLFTGNLIVAGALKAWLFMTVPLLFIWVIFGIRNYYIHKKMGIWNYYRKKTRNGKLNI
jgi:hypothetical protein